MRRWWRVVLAASVVLAVTLPMVWEATRPPATAGVRPVATSVPESPPVAAVAETATAAAPQVGRTSSSAINDLRIVPDIAPVALRAPRVEIEALVAPVGIAAGSAAAMEVPEDPGRAGWYRHGPAPGDPEGVAVITAHVDSARTGPGAFFRLRELGPGDQVIVDLADGRVLTYQVQAREQMAKGALPTADLFRRSGAPALALVTCGGAFDRSRGSYEDNLIVWAVPRAG